MVDMLASLYMETNMHIEALRHIENAKRCGRELPLFLTVKAGICHAYHGDIEQAEICFSLLQRESEDHINLITAVANSFISLQHYESALKYYLMLEENFFDRVDNGIIHLKMAHCSLALNRRELAIEFFYAIVVKSTGVQGTMVSKQATFPISPTFSLLKSIVTMRICSPKLRMACSYGQFFGGMMFRLIPMRIASIAIEFTLLL
ncbi:hypothetical protein Nepgr_027576 [Nepenthes gracilis]|uniref:Uncharacterized protein n=1 Tax=Nepenthes gracilis TaxID=150966 RepID=A0AAD3TAS4_NEPGR|nr:hypothetical protein Nepgr_027576 [Nepenthes gracilis]